MITFHADDYGINTIQTERILDCSPKNGGVLNSVSIMPNSRHLNSTIPMLLNGVKKGIHINLAEGNSCANPEDIPLLVKDGVLYHGFLSLLSLSFIHPKQLEDQLSTEILAQIHSVTSHMDDNYKIRIDSHVHCHMIPVVFRALCNALSRSGHEIEYIRFPTESIWIYLRCPSIWKHIKLINMAKVLFLNFFGKINRHILRRYGYEKNTGAFFGVVFTGRMYGRHILKILQCYTNYVEKSGKNLEVLFHPGGIHEGEEYLRGCNGGFKAVYNSEDREKEADMLRELGKNWTSLGLK